MRFVRDPCGVACLIITYGAVFYAEYVVIWIILPMQTSSLSLKSNETLHSYQFNTILNVSFNEFIERFHENVNPKAYQILFFNSAFESLWAPLHVVLFNTIVFLLGLSHVKAVFCDPGTVSKRLDFADMHTSEKMSGNGNGNGWTICSRCETYRPPRAHHCRICKKCIRRMDHHCPWINNCVGERNQKFFLQFLVYVGILSLYSIGLVVGSFIYPHDEEEPTTKNTLEAQTRLLHSIVLLLESVLFGLFVIAIMVDQIHAILFDETAVESVQQKGAYRPNRRKMHLLADVFGRGHPALWLFPCTSFHGTSTRYHDAPLLSHDV